MGRTFRGQVALLTAAASLAMSAGRASADAIMVSPGELGQSSALTVSSGVLGQNAALANSMVSALVGSGVTASNATFTGNAAAAGTFSGTGGILPFSSGILLTTGAAANVIGPNTANNAGTSNGLAGDSQLSAQAGAQTFDASTLEFDFTSTSDVMSFRFVFASEEYNEYAPPNLNTFNDAFAFYVNGVNIALLPGTNTPVSIRNVNQISNAGYFTDNTGGLYDTQMDGLVGATTALFATKVLVPGAMNHIKIVIADTRDMSLDSAVFLQAGSFTNTPPPTSVPLPGVALAGMALIGGTGLSKLRRNRRRAATAA